MPKVDVVTAMTCRNSPGTIMTGFGCVGVQLPPRQCLCVAGDETMGGINVARVNGQPWHETALAHELLHRILETETGDADSEHRGPRWGTDLEAANAKLVEAGL